jgi:hypothetical protein
MSDSEAGSAGSVYAGPRVRVRRGRMGKVPRKKERSGQHFFWLSVRDSSSYIILIKGRYLPIRETSWSSRKIEWYA